MKSIKDYTDEELRYGIDRCNARLAGIMPMGILCARLVKEALRSYQNELDRRGVKVLDFK